MTNVEGRDFNSVVISLRLKGAEAVRFWNLLDKAKDKNPYIDKSHVIRELLGLDPPKILTQADIERFRLRAGSR
jgi:hypothetical protein